MPYGNINGGTQDAKCAERKYVFFSVERPEKKKSTV